MEMLTIRMEPNPRATKAPRREASGLLRLAWEGAVHADVDLYRVRAILFGALVHADNAARPLGQRVTRAY